MKHILSLLLIMLAFPGVDIQARQLDTSRLTLPSERRSVLPTVSLSPENDGLYQLQRRDGTYVPRTKYHAIGNDIMSDHFQIWAGCPLPVMDENKKWGLIDIKGTVIVPCKYDYMSIEPSRVIKVRTGEKYGFLDYSGREIVPLRYTSLSYSFGGVIVADIDCGDSPSHIYDTKGNLLREDYVYSYDYRDRFGSVLILGNHDAGFSLWDGKKGKILSGPHEYIYCDGEFMPYKSAGLYGVLSAISGDVVIPAQFDEVFHFYGGEYAKVVKDGRHSIIDRRGNTYLSLPAGYQFDYDGRYADFYVPYNRFIIKNESTRLCGIVDKTGREVIPCRYGRITPCVNTPTLMECKIGPIDYLDTETTQIDYVNSNSGKIVLSLKATGSNPEEFTTRLPGGGEWHLISAVERGYLRLKEVSGDRYSVVDDNGNVIIDNLKSIVPVMLPDYTYMQGIYLASLVDDPHGAGLRLYDAGKRKMVTGPELSDDDLACPDDHTLVVSTKNDTRQVLIYDMDTGSATRHRLDGKPIRIYSGDGLFQTTGRNVYDKNGNVMFAIPDGLVVDSFNEGLARISKGFNSLYGYIDRAGKIVIPCDISLTYGFNDGRALIVKDGRVGFIDKTGAVVIPCEYDGATFFENGKAIVKKNGAYGVIDTTGREVIPCRYTDYLLLGHKLKMKNCILIP